MRLSIFIFLWIYLLGLSYGQPLEDFQKEAKFYSENRIVSLSGTITEILFKIGLGDKIVGVDVTSTFPKEVSSIPKVGHNRNISAEGVISLNPNLILGNANSLKPEVMEQLKQTGVEIKLFEQKYSVEGTEELIRKVCKEMDKAEEADPLIEQIQSSLTKVVPFEAPPAVLFIYARGAGTLMVAGEETSLEEIIALAGAKNAISGFTDFKPLTPEALIQANPEVILLFESGLQSLEGEEGLMAIPRIAQTRAGKNRRFVSMDGNLLSGFGPRLGDAASQLNKALKEAFQ